MNTMLLKYVFCVTISIFIVQITYAQSPHNPGFEFQNNLNTDWRNTPNGGTALAIGARSNTVYRTGDYSYGSASVNTTGLWNHRNASNLSIAPNAYVHVIAWAKRLNADSRAGLGGSMGGSDDNGGTTPLTTDNWTRLTSYNRQNTTASAVNFQCGLYFRSNTAGVSTQVFFDDVIAYTDNVAAPDLTSPTPATSSSNPVVGNNSLTINWTNGTDAGTGIQNTIILRTTNINATAPTLNNQGVYSTTGGANGPNVVNTDWTIISTTVSAVSNSYSDNTVLPNTAYKYAIIHRDLAYNYSTALVVSAISQLSNNISASAIASCASCDLILAQDANFIIDVERTFNSIVAAPGAKITLGNGNLILNNQLILQSGENGNATFVDNSVAENPLAVSAIVQQYFSSARNWYMTVPVGNYTVPVGQTFYTYDETGSNTSFVAPATAYWTAVEEGSLIANPAKAYILQPGGGSTILFDGVLNSGNYSIVLSRTTSNPKTGFNLVANPYPSYLNAMAAINANTAIEPTIWYRTRSVGQSPQYYFETVNTSSGEGTNNAGTGFVSGYVPPMQGFWVRTNTDAQTLTFNNSMRYHANPLVGEVQINTTALKAPVQNMREALRLQLVNSNGRDELLIYRHNDAKNSFDKFDSKKMLSDNNLMPQIASKTDEELLAINGLVNVENLEIALETRVSMLGNYTLKVSENTFDNNNYEIILLDNILNTSVILGKQTEYTFNASHGAFSDNRFSIQFRAASFTTNNKNINKSNDIEVSYSINNSSLIIKSADGVIYSIYNAQGQLMQSSVYNLPVSLSGFANGIYIVKVNNNVYRILKQ